MQTLTIPSAKLRNIGSSSIAFGVKTNGELCSYSLPGNGAYQMKEAHKGLADYIKFCDLHSPDEVDAEYGKAK